jgi:hypothetical protein
MFEQAPAADDAALDLFQPHLAPELHWLAGFVTDHPDDYSAVR